MKGTSRLNNTWIAALLLALLVGLGPLTSLAPPSVAESGGIIAPLAGQFAADAALVEQSPVTVDDDWWATVQEDIRKSEYHVTWQEQTYLEDLPAAYQAPNRAENIRTYFAPTGPILIPRTWAEETAMPPWRWAASLVAWGRADSLQAALQAELSVQDNLVEYQRGDNLEWYRNSEDGLEQGFSLLSPPAGELDGQPLQIELELGGDLRPELALEGAEIEFRAPGDDGGFRYGGLEAVDATGTLLPASLALEGSTLMIQIEDANAIYPIKVGSTITGLPSSHDWAITFGTAGAEFSTSVATAGDVDGDGYSEMIIGAPEYDSGQPEAGAAFVYYGSADGLYFADWIEDIGQAGAHYGHSVATAGDVNGDGYADVIVGAPDYSNGQAGEGGTWVYHGSASGLSHGVATHDEGQQAGAAFGHSVATAGDVNGDGYADVIVGALLWTETRTEEGRVWDWHGSEDGHSETNNWWAVGGATNASLGNSVSTAGDVNGDGYADIIVGAQRRTVSYHEQGAAYVWLGSEAGISSTAPRILTINQGGARFGWSVSTAGDVNGDGYADVIVGAPFYDNGQTDEGGAWLHLGSSSGVNATPANHDEGNKTGARFGYSVATAGDVNGDGLADIIVGAPDGSPSNPNQMGRAFVWHGQHTSTGVSTSTDWNDIGEQADALFGASVATAGDVNGDGYSDIIVGAPGHASAAGRAYVYHGQPDSLNEEAGWTKVSNMEQALFGFSVGTAGDVNGDGYADVIAGAPRWDGGYALEGGAWVYLGSADGLQSAPNWYKRSGKEFAEFGYSVGTAGDVNGDGYDDVIVGAPGWHNAATDEGGVWIYKGSSTGVESAPLWHKESNQVGARFGTSVGTAGDVNGDGYSDVIAGAPFYSHGQSEEGMAWVYLGADPVPYSAPAWDGESNQADAEYGHAVGTAGDVNGDGYSDIIVGAPEWQGDFINEGRAWVHLGSRGGVQDGHNWDAEGNNYNANLGYSVGTAGDVNGDGYSDVIVGGPGYGDDGLTGEGKVWVFHGAATGLENGSSWSREGGQNSAHYGWSVGTAGDVNGDGYADVIIGVEGWNGGLLDEGGASLYHGAYGGLESSRAWHGEGEQATAHYGYSVGTAGDVNGDGSAEVIVGAPNYTLNHTDEGRAFLYYGNDGPGAALRPVQRHFSGAPLAHLGLTEDMDEFRVRVLYRNPFGRGRQALWMEFKVLGASFDNTNTGWWGFYEKSVPGTEASIVFRNLAAGTPYHWRVRWRYDPATTPFLPAGPWVTMPWNGWNELDLRTNGDRIFLPVVLRDHQ